MRCNFRKGIFIIPVLFLFASCLRDDLMVDEKSKIIHRKIYGSELLKDKKLVNEVRQFGKKLKPEKQAGVHQRTFNDSIVVNLSIANYVETEDFVSYTFDLVSTSEDLQNLLLIRNKHTETAFRGYFIEYLLTPEEMQLLENEQMTDLNDKVRATQIHSHFTLIEQGSKSGGSYDNVEFHVDCYGWVGVCYVGDSNGHAAYGSACVVSSVQFLQIGCGSMGGFIGGGDGGFTPSNPDPSDPHPTNPDTGGGSNSQVLVMPTKNTNTPLLLEEETDDCLVLKDLVMPNKQNVKPILTQLGQKITGNSKNEWGSTLYFQNQYIDSLNSIVKMYHNTPLEEGTPVSAVVKTGYDNGQMYYSSAHNHTNNGYAIPSFQDVRLLLNTYNAMTEMYKEMVTVLIVVPNKDNPAEPITYALRVNDIEKLQVEVNKIWNASKYSHLNELKRIEEIHADLAVDYEENIDNLEKYFLELFGNYCIKLFKSHSQNQGWSELEISKFSHNLNAVTQAPCP